MDIKKSISKHKKEISMIYLCVVAVYIIVTNI